MTMKRSLAYQLLAQGGVFVFGFANAVLSAKVLGTEGKGQLAIYMLAMEMGAALMMVGMSQALQYHAARNGFRSQKPLNTAVVFGAACTAIFFLAVQVATGILLMPYYRPSAQEAFESIEFIMTTVSFGWLIRSVHAWSANLMVFFAVLHLVTVC